METPSAHPNLETLISTLPTPGNWVNLKGLISCASKYLSTQEDASEPSLECTSISLLGSGTHNYVYRLCFSSGLQLAASIPKTDEEAFFPAGRLSEIATMKFVAESGLYPDIPVPKIHAWEVGFNNEAGAPWTLMELVHGAHVDSEHAEGGGVGVTGFDLYPEDMQMAIVKALARLQGHLSKPMPFDKIGSIYLRENDQKKGSTTTAGFEIGPLTQFGQRIHHDSLGGPYTSPAHMYTTLLQGHMSHALRNWCSLHTDSICDPDSPFPLGLTPRTFSDIFHMLTSLIPQFTLPQSTSALVLHHPDIALRNIFFDEASLKEGTPRITGVIDWSGAQILPLMLTAIFPGDLMSSTRTPFQPSFFRRNSRPESTIWSTVPFDWTSTGNPTNWPWSWVHPQISVRPLPCRYRDSI
ncbi:hypothetical protein D9619_003666 [Psilocybe cf. subviscida]|uniref:Aminoglycoside phosphotransferase domain-containing protein n=1 Tax=Psilocybe cf. subviscida TaxID=2480587 RepID=A0A8H5AW60_9AGAR|nr:hypothetical protein D9619_003666 [Psilocybe cf. subviscida]